MGGWISLHRQVQDHWLWKEKRELSKFEAWTDILLNVNHSEARVVIKNTVYNIGRGESVMSLKNWADRWNWSRSRVKRFLSLLEKDEMIRMKSDTNTTHLTICKYDSYQGERNDNETKANIKRTSDEHQTATNNKNNNEKNEKNDNKKSENIISYSSDSLNKSIGIKKTINNYDYKQIIKSSKNQGKLRNLFVDVKHSYNGWEDVQIHSHLDQAMNNYATHYRIKKLNIDDEKHLMNSFVVFAKKHWGKNDTNIRNLK
tara:strand:+ start:746 stop:1519 length:774 start_codon:yes stop_codon:yes gene_type:complete